MFMQKEISKEESTIMCYKKLNYSLSSHGLKPRGFSRSKFDKNPPSKKESKKVFRNHNLFEDDKRELRKIKNAIYKNPEVKRLTSKILKDDGAWKPFKDLINAIRESHPAITGVYYGDDPHFLGGYRWKNGKMTGKYRVIEIETEFGTMNGHIICFGAGTIEDPLDAYDMVLEIY